MILKLESFVMHLFSLYLQLYEYQSVLHEFHVLHWWNFTCHCCVL